MLSAPLALDPLLALATTPHATRTRAVTAPFTGALLAEVPEGTAACVAAAFARARAVQPAWAATPVAARTAVLRRLERLVHEHREAICSLMQVEGGKARRHALEEVLDVVLTARYYARAAPALLRPQRRRGVVPLLTHVEEQALPVGVVGIIAPWNYPFTLALSDALAALVAGNAVVLKPSEWTPLTALLGLHLLHAAGLPEGVMQVVPGAGAVAGEALTAHADFVQFTGSTATGRRVAAQAAARLVPCSMELGGKNAAVVLDDAPLDATVEGLVRACFANAGQLCISAERLLVHTSRYSEVRDALHARIARMVVGPGAGYDVEMGSLAASASFDKTAQHVADAVAKGARVVCGGHPLPHLGPLFYAPTLLENVRPGMRAHDEETFGPVVALEAFATDAEAIARVNSTEYGLNASLWTADLARGRRLARHIRTGTVGINDGYAAAWGSTDAPMGGMKASGLGRRHGAYGLLKYTEAQTVAAQRGHGLGPSPSVPADPYFQTLARLTGWLGHIPGA